MAARQERGVSETAAAAPKRYLDGTVLRVLAAISACHLINDMLQSLLPAIYPMLKNSLTLDFGQVGLITLAYQLIASVLQPIVGFYADRRARPYSLAIGMGSTLLGLVLLSMADSFGFVLLAAALIGMGSSVFHPEASRVARMASGGRHGFAQSLFQVGGSCGSAIGPLLAAFVVLQRGQGSIAWFSIVAFAGIVLLIAVGGWYKRNHLPRGGSRGGHGAERSTLPKRKVWLALGILLALIFSKFFYTASIGSYYTFYLIEKFHVSVQNAQIYLFVFLGASAAGTFIGGPIGDRFGRKYVIWGSILGVLPFTLMLPYASLSWTVVLSILIGLILSSAFAAIVVYAQELVPGRVGMITGLFFGLAFGMGGIGAGALGQLADLTSMEFVYRVCSFLPAIGLVAIFLPNLETAVRRRAAA
ncbi:MAG: MFS transporter [Alphaproteobacteria bacterium]|nr:MFS transporter [Alphaproteobacteria bacterium]